MVSTKRHAPRLETFWMGIPIRLSTRLTTRSRRFWRLIGGLGGMKIPKQAVYIGMLLFEWKISILSIRFIPMKIRIRLVSAWWTGWISRSAARWDCSVKNSRRESRVSTSMNRRYFNSGIPVNLVLRWWIKWIPTQEELLISQIAIRIKGNIKWFIMFGAQWSLMKTY